MTKSPAHGPDNLITPEERIRWLAQEKSYLQLIIHMMNQLGGIGDLDGCIHSILSGVVENIGGTDARLYVFLDDTVRSADLMGADEILTSIEDSLVLEVMELRKPFAIASDFVATHLIAKPFERAWTWVVPLMVGSEVVAVLKLSDTHLSLDEMSDVVPTLFRYMALSLRNALARSRLEKAYGAVRDVNERLTRTVDTLTRTNAELERFVHVASHDLQEPVRTVVSFTQLLERQLGDRLTPDDRPILEYIVNGAHRMSDLLHDLLSYSRLTGQDRRHGPVDLNDVLTAARDNILAAIQERGAEIRIDPLPRIHGDRVQLIGLFQNLLSNAVKFTAPDVTPSIHVFAEAEGEFWRISVADNGIGIAPDYFDQIFVIFQRLHAGPAYPGTGIGLAVCKRIVEQHGGRIWVDSAEGHGATFHVTLPGAENGTAAQ